MMKDIKNDCIWVFGSLSLDKIDLDNEDNDVWYIFIIFLLLLIVNNLIL